MLLCPKYHLSVNALPVAAKECQSCELATHTASTIIDCELKAGYTLLRQLGQAITAPSAQQAQTRSGCADEGGEGG